MAPGTISRTFSDVADNQMRSLNLELSHVTISLCCHNVCAESSAAIYVISCYGSRVLFCHIHIRANQIALENVALHSADSPGVDPDDMMRSFCLMFCLTWNSSRAQGLFLFFWIAASLNREGYTESSSRSPGRRSTFHHEDEDR
jgi:hypothetical protein